MTDKFASIPLLERTLWYMAEASANRRIPLRQIELANRTEPLVVLGEAGMGKSSLLRWLGDQPGHAFCTARKLINSRFPERLLGDASVLVIDALDELPAQKDGEGVSLVLRKLGDLNYPRFILSCRVADWRSATGCESIGEQYDQPPIELHLEPLTQDEVTKFLEAHLRTVMPATVVAHFEQRGLGELLTNPQTLELIAKVAQLGNLPQSRYELFETAVEEMRREQNTIHRESQSTRQPSVAAGLDASGAAFAALILTGHEALARDADAGDIPLCELVELPGGNNIRDMLGTRLFRAVDTDRYSYWHRSIGEFLGARWLARQADTPRKRRRMLRLLHSRGLVPTSLRGLHAWLASDPALAPAIIETDPLGVVQYGDAERLTLPQTRGLLTALKREAERNPACNAWHIPAARGLFHPELAGDIRSMIASPDIAFWLRAFLVESARSATGVAALQDELRRMLTDQAIPLGLRRRAIDTLVGVLEDTAWREITNTLHHTNSDDDRQLALHVLDEVGYHLLDDASISELAYTTISASNRVIGVLYFLERNLPTERLDGVLNAFASKVHARGKPQGNPADGDLTRFTYTLLDRRLAASAVSAPQLWTWLEPFEGSKGYHDDAQTRVETRLRSDGTLRREIQRLVMLDQPGEDDVQTRAWHLVQCSPSLNPSPDDIVAILHLLDPSRTEDTRWHDLVERWGAHEAVRVAARPFAAHDAKLLALLDVLADPPQPEWMRERAERQRIREERESAQRELHRTDYQVHIDEVRSGRFGAIIGPAEAYLKRYTNIGQDLPAHQRIASWLGDDVAAAAHVGLESFLQAVPPDPTATDIVKTLCDGKFLRATSIIVAALAERIRTGTGLADLPDERLLAGLFAVRDGMFARQAGLDSLEEVVEFEVRVRGLYEQAMRGYYEPQLQAGKEYCSGLETLMHSDADEALATTLALEWLDSFETLPNSVRQELMARVVHSPRNASLRPFLAQHAGENDAQYRCLLDAASILVDFDGAIQRLAQTTIPPELLWEIHDLSTVHETRRQHQAPLNVPQIEWVFSTFRTLWPMAYHPSGGWSGSRNSWDASEYLVALLRRLGTNPGEQATAALKRLQSVPRDGYSDTISSIAMEQAQQHAEASYSPPVLGDIASALRDSAPVTIKDLQGVVLEELAVVQRKIGSDDAESWRGFFDDDGVPYAEERCRDHLIGLLRQGGTGIRFDLETHVAQDKEVDITCAIGDLRLPIEVKGQWHRDLWHAADTQLDRFYTVDWQAERRGIYLVLWFDATTAPNKRLVGPGANRTAPTTPAALREALIERNVAARDGRIEVFVLDATHVTP